MRRKMKGFGVVLVAMLALGAIGAQGASGHEFTSDVENTVLTGHSEAGNDLTITTNTGAATKCKGFTLRGEQLGGKTADTVTLVPSTTECTFAGNPATVVVKDCAWVLDSDTNGSGHADVDTECAEGGQIEIVTSACTLDMRAQTAMESGAHYYNETADKTVTVETTLTNIKVAQKTGSAILCAFAGTTATLASVTTWTGYEHKGRTGTTTTPTYTEGNKVGISVSGADSKA